MSQRQREGALKVKCIEAVGWAAGEMNKRRGRGGEDKN